jgi:hypothetical protein
MESSVRPADLQAWARQFSEGEFTRRMSAILKEIESAESGAAPHNAVTFQRG